MRSKMTFQSPHLLQRVLRSPLLSWSLALLLEWLAIALPAFAATQLHSQSITPATITFLANDPDNPTVPGNVTATISFRTTGGATTRNWRVEVQAAGGGNLGGCPSPIPISRITVTCVTASPAPGGTGACGAPFNLSNGLQMIASGAEGAGNAAPYSVSVNFSFQDSWRYIATSTPCTVSLLYQITAN